MRYNRVATLEGDMYAPGSPVIIRAGALLDDTIKEQILVQLKLQNISNHVIIAANVRITPCDVIGKQIGEPFEYHYLDLNVKRDSYFGENIPIYIKERECRNVILSVVKVIYDTKEIWESNSSVCESLPLLVKLGSVIKDPELIRQFQITYGSDCNYVPDTYKDLWRCACGGVNRDNESHCHICGNQKSVMLSINLHALREDCNNRLEEQKQKEAEKCREQHQKRVRIVKIAGKAMIVVAAVMVVILGIVFYCNNSAVDKKTQEQMVNPITQKTKKDESPMISNPGSTSGEDREYKFTQEDVLRTSKRLKVCVRIIGQSLNQDGNFEPPVTVYDTYENFLILKRSGTLQFFANDDNDAAVPIASPYDHHTDIISSSGNIIIRDGKMMPDEPGEITTVAWIDNETMTKADYKIFVNGITECIGGAPQVYESSTETPYPVYVWEYNNQVVITSCYDSDSSLAVLNVSKSE